MVNGIKAWLIVHIVHSDTLYKGFAPETWAAWALVIVGAYTAFVALRTLKAIHHEAEIAMEIAQAANLNTQAIINSERAWLVATIEVNEGKETSYKIAVLNQGRTPAKLIGGDSAHCFIDLPDNLPIPPVYKAPFFMPNQTFIVSRDSFPIRPFFAPEKIIDHSGMRELAEQSQQFLMFYGRIVYEDMFSGARPKPVRHETRWCYAYLPQTREFKSCGPDEYRGHCDQGHESSNGS
jgi:hypothetical protein